VETPTEGAGDAPNNKQKEKNMKAQKDEHTPHRKTRTFKNTRAYCYLSCDIFDQNDKALGYVEVDQFGIDVYPKGAKKPSRRLDWGEAMQRLLA
jgi:hypothetical protein